jgi:hypothetical protein
LLRETTTHIILEDYPMGIKEKLRRWLDDDTFPHPLDQSSPQTIYDRKASNDLFLKLPRVAYLAIDHASLRLPDGPVIVPNFCVVFISQGDRKCWTTRQVKGIEKWLQRVVLKKVSEALLTEQDLESIDVEVRMDATLPACEVWAKTY